MHILSPAPVARTPVAQESRTAQRMAEAATALVASLTPAQAARCVYPVESGLRRIWTFKPVPRRGLAMKDLEPFQQRLAFALLSSGLSRRAYMRALNIMALERVLRDIEGPGGRHVRDSENYFVAVFGQPDEPDPWGWRVEGHHLSLNFLVVAGSRIAPTPCFFGANPACVPPGNVLGGLRALAPEEDLARQLLTALGEAGYWRALMAAEAPSEILTGTARHVKPEDPVGLPYAEMDERAKVYMNDLLAEYLARMPMDVAETRMNQIEKEGKGYVHFAWAGSATPGEGHYYRIHGPSFLIEYDNTQDHANHIHTVWRDFRDDWGHDLLRQHYTVSHWAR